MFIYKTALFTYNFRELKTSLPQWKTNECEGRLRSETAEVTEGIKKGHQQTFRVIKGSLSGFGDGFTSVCIKQNLLYSLNVYIVLRISYSSKTFHKFKKT